MLNQLEGLGNLSLVWKLFHPSPFCPVPDLTLINSQVLPLSVCGLYFVFPLSWDHRLTWNIPALLSKLASLVHCRLSPLFVDFLAQILMSSFVHACIAFRYVTGVPVMCRYCWGGLKSGGTPTQLPILGQQLTDFMFCLFLAHVYSVSDLITWQGGNWWWVCNFLVLQAFLASHLRCKVLDYSLGPIETDWTSGSSPLPWMYWCWLPITPLVLQDAGAGLLAAAMIAVVPGYISRSVAGSYDNEGKT